MNSGLASVSPRPADADIDRGIAWLVTPGSVSPCAIIAPIRVMKIDRDHRIVSWRVPGQPFDVERKVRFEEVHRSIKGALAHARAILESGEKEISDDLQT